MSEGEYLNLKNETSKVTCESTNKFKEGPSGKVHSFPNTSTYCLIYNYTRFECFKITNLIRASTVVELKI